jgi:hypothetical protein
MQALIGATRKWNWALDSPSAIKAADDVMKLDSAAVDFWVQFCGNELADRIFARCCQRQSRREEGGEREREIDADVLGWNHWHDVNPALPLCTYTYTPPSSPSSPSSPPDC